VAPRALAYRTAAFIEPKWEGLKNLSKEHNKLLPLQKSEEEKMCTGTASAMKVLNRQNT